ncbi:uncharacterized protein LOC120425434 [Culex pipiens pallens]|uniref:uncharacterized protein LOC120425434 n=1 Tax=Culex pipiens pallens TaxID=42434 RepID=UPI0019537FED|nr:uncharacterized protein LOC120425434 [Culex pipiens pallens]
MATFGGDFQIVFLRHRQRSDSVSVQIFTPRSLSREYISGDSAGHRQTMWTHAVTLLLVLAVTLADFGHGAIYPEDDTQENLLTVVPCVKRLCEKYFKSERAMKGSLAIINIKPDTSAFQLNILKSFNDDPRHEMGVMVKDGRKKHWNASHVTEKAKNYLLLISVSSELDAPINQLRRLPTWNPLAQVVVLFTSEMTPLVFQIEVRNALQKLFENSVLNVNVMVQRYNTSVLEVWTWFPYENGGCADNILNIRLMDECEYVEVSMENAADKMDEKSEFIAPELEYSNVTAANSSLEVFIEQAEQAGDSFAETVWLFREKHYFSDYGPKIPKDYNYCPLMISTPIWEPFVVGNETSIEKGLEVLMIEVITARMKLTPVYRFIDPLRAAATITADNSTGFYADLIQRRTDLMIGGLYENPISRRLLSSSIPYFQDDLTWCVPTARHAPKWLNVFIIFNVWIWLVAIIIIFVAAAIIYCLNHVEHRYPENYTWMLLQSLAFSLSVYAHYWPQRFSIRFFLVGYMIYGLHWSAAYHSFLISVLTRPRFEPQISTVEAAMANKFQFAGPENTLVHFDKPDSVSRFITSVYQVCPDRDDCLARLHSERNLAVAMSRAHSHNSKSIGEAEIFCFDRKDNIQTYSVGMMVKKDFHLLPKINDLIRRISESGLLGKWQVESDKIRVDEDLEDGGGDDGGHGDGQIVLKVEHIEGAFILGAIGLGLSTVAFIGEIVYFNFKNRYKWNDSMFSRLFC